MARRSFVGFLILCILTLVAVAQESPTLVQPGSAGFSPAQLTVLQGAITQLQYLLNNSSYGSKKQLGSGGWTQATFAAYTAGSLERLGYQASIVSQPAADGGTDVWVAVRADLGGAIAWIPVEPSPSGDIYQPDLGNVPLMSPLVYDSRYLTYDAVVELAPNIPPTASIRVPGTDVGEGSRVAFFGNASMDPDGEIVLYQWTFGEDVQRVTRTISAWYTFAPGGREYPVALTVTDSRGAQASTTTSLYVLTLQEVEDRKCGCGH
jgi:hypothetical protein